MVVKPATNPKKGKGGKKIVKRGTGTTAKPKQKGSSSRNELFGLSKPGIRRSALKAKVERMAAATYPQTAKDLVNHLSQLCRTAVLCTDAAKRKTLQRGDFEKSIAQETSRPPPIIFSDL